MITELSEQHCQTCNRRTITRIGRRDGLAVVQGALANCDIWRCRCPVCRFRVFLCAIGLDRRANLARKNSYPNQNEKPAKC